MQLITVFGEWDLKPWLLLAGWAQILLATVSSVIPKILKWKHELAKVQPLIKQMFWTYAAYILVINLCFGLLSVFAAEDFLNGSKLAMLINGFIAVYWVTRVLIQFFYFDKTNFPTGKLNKLGEVLLVMLFLFLSIVYSCTFYTNLIHK